MKNKKSLLTRIFAAMLSLSLIVPGGIVFAEENSENVQDTSTIAASVNEIEGQTVKESDADSLNQEDASDAAPVADVEESEKNRSEEKSEDSNDELSQKEEKENTKDANKDPELSKAEVIFEDGEGAFSSKKVHLNRNAKFGGANVEKEEIDQPSAYDTNTPPVAGLQYVVLNPESLKNGNITTATQIAWLWSYNGENFTYDPDGDEITNIMIGGISSSDIIGNISGNIGFATQFSTPGQYQMTYQVQDSRGALSNILKIVINVESADSNTRPINNAVFAPSNGEVYTDGPCAISWVNCVDNDAGDYISDVRGQVYANGSEKAENISKYLTKVDSEKKQILFAFPEAGTYQVWFSVSDSHGAWSDWAIFNYTVTERPVPSITLSEYCVQQNSTPNWYKYSEALAYDNEDADYIFNAVTRPLPDDYRDLVGSEIRIRGKVAYDDGPVANKTVRIYMSVPGCYPIEGTVQTDSSGNFDYHITQKEFFEMTTGRYAPGGVNGVIGEWAYVSGYSTKFISQTKLIIACDGAVEEIPVSTVTGLAALKIVGKWGQRPGGQWQVWN